MNFQRKVVDALHDQAEDIKQRSKGWRNCWYAVSDGIQEVSNRFIAAGSIWEGRTVHPSKKVAEAIAMQWLARHPGSAKGLEYLGAFEVQA